MTYHNAGICHETSYQCIGEAVEKVQRPAFHLIVKQKCIFGFLRLIAGNAIEFVFATGCRANGIRMKCRKWHLKRRGGGMNGGDLLVQCQF